MSRSSQRCAWVGALALTAAGGCVAGDSPILDGADGCDEFVVGQPVSDSLAVDETVLGFLQAASDLGGAAVAVAGPVADACAGIALDLGAPDTWSELDEADRLANGAGTGACDVAAALVEEQLVAAGTVEADVAIAITRGECHVDFTALAECELGCLADLACQPGSIETRCEPGSLSVICETSCEAGGECVGSAALPANCMGQCEAECVGHCQGTCIGPDGERTEDDPSCVGKCASACNGECRGTCKIEAAGGVSCGAGVRCTGGCTGEFSDPECVAVVDPPSCEVDAGCYARCEAEAAASAVCEPPHVAVFADVEQTPALAPLVATLERNLPPLVDAAERQAGIALEAGARLGDTARVLGDRLADLDGKSLACLGAATSAVLEAVAVLDVSVRASASVTVTTSEQAL